MVLSPPHRWAQFRGPPNAAPRDGAPEKGYGKLQKYQQNRKRDREAVFESKLEDIRRRRVKREREFAKVKDLLRQLGGDGAVAGAAQEQLGGVGNRPIVLSNIAGGGSNIAGGGVSSTAGAIGARNRPGTAPGRTPPAPSGLRVPGFVFNAKQKSFNCVPVPGPEDPRRPATAASTITRAHVRARQNAVVGADPRPPAPGVVSAPDGSAGAPPTNIRPRRNYFGADGDQRDRTDPRRRETATEIAKNGEAFIDPRRRETATEIAKNGEAFAEGGEAFADQPSFPLAVPAPSEDEDLAVPAPSEEFLQEQVDYDFHYAQSHLQRMADDNDLGILQDDAESDCSSEDSWGGGVLLELGEEVNPPSEAQRPQSSYAASLFGRGVVEEQGRVGGRRRGEQVIRLCGTSAVMISTIISDYRIDRLCRRA